MRSAKKWLAILICLLFSALIIPAQDAPPGAAKASKDVTIIIGREQVRFAAQKAVEQMQLQVINQFGEVVYDSGVINQPEINWPLRNGLGEDLKNGLYAYILSLKEVGAETAGVRRGHLIVDRVKERDNTDKLWVTSQSDGGVGTALIVARNEQEVVAGTAIGNDRTLDNDRSGIKRDGRDSGGREIKREAQNGADASKTVSVAASAAGTVGRIAKFTSATEVGDSLIAESNDKLGVGTAAPVTRLHILDGPTNPGVPRVESTHPASFAAGWDFYHGATGKGYVGVPGASASFGAGELMLYGGPGTRTSLWGAGNRGLTVNTDGNVGIGTLTPESPLHVHGGAGITVSGPGAAYFFRNRETTTSTDYWAWYAQSGNAHFWRGGVGNLISITPNGNIGFGTEAPAAKLHVTGYVRADGVGNEQTYLGGDGIGNDAQLGSMNPSINDVVLWNLATNKYMKLVTGSVTIAGGADFAENFDVHADAAAAIQPGMVVAIDPAEPGKLKLSRRPYDRRVAGIISGAGDVKPGMTMGAAGTLADGKQPVALSGRVYVWVDAARTPVKPGDLLTTSATPGHAMKASNTQRAQGAIIGKAMTSLQSGKGLVLVLVTLQ